MLANFPHMHPRTRLLFAGLVGFLAALLVTWNSMMPALGLIAQLPRFSPLLRAAFLVKVLSPLLSFFVVGGWVWVLQPVGERFITRWKGRSIAHHTTLQPDVRPQESIMEFLTAASRTSARGRLIVVPPLFQRDPMTPWHSTHLPEISLPTSNAVGSTHEHRGSEENEPQNDLEWRAESAPSVHVKQDTPPQMIDVSLQASEERGKAVTSGVTRENISFYKPGEPVDSPKPVTLTLLKHIRAWVRADDGTTIEVKLRGGENAIRLIQLAYIAWRKGGPVDRDKMMTYVLSRGKRRDMNTDQLGEVFDAAKRYLRQDLDRAVNELKKNDHLVSGDIDFFSNEPGFYWLHTCCQVVDLEKIEAYYHPIQIARKEGLLNEKLDGSLPAWVVEACQNLVGAYPGDFLQALLEKFPEEFGAWVKEPVTLFRDRYLDALLILANHESALGKNAFDENLTLEQNEEQRRHHIGRAAQLFSDYASYAINSRWDQKLKFAYRVGKDGERVVRAARAMRRCVVELGKLGNPDMIDQAYLTFKERMSTLSEGNWKPDRDTESDVTEAKQTTNAYRFTSQILVRQDSKSNA